jgi:DNA-directed RNA polymerase subunit M/transcription elongation factor TFIIS
MDDDKLIYEFLDNLIKSPTYPAEIQTCPICGGKFHVWFGAYKRFEEDLFGVTVKCESCGINIAIDYGVAPPPWLVPDK